MNTMFVDISGVTITSGTTYAEAGVAFFNTSGAIRNSVVGPLVRAADGTELAARPHGWGVVATSYYHGAEAGPRHEVTLDGTLVTGYQSGGVLFDDRARHRRLGRHADAHRIRSSTAPSRTRASSAPAPTR